MTVYHTTPVETARRILAHGFVDTGAARAREQRGESELLGRPAVGGCFVADRPLEPRDVAADLRSGAVVLAVDLPADVLDVCEVLSCRPDSPLAAARAALYRQFFGNGWRPYREWYVECATLNRCPVRVVATIPPAPRWRAWEQVLARRGRKWDPWVAAVALALDALPGDEEAAAMQEWLNTTARVTTNTRFDAAEMWA